jgi:drug/metabolite transporter (DMT)-like permease
VFAVWVGLAFLVAACWGLTVVVNKRTLSLVDPIALNVILRGPTLTIMLIFVVPLTAFHGWDLGFAMTWEAAGYIALSAAVTWLIAFNAYYLALPLGSVGVVSPIMATDPVFTALFAVLILGASLGSMVLAGLVIATAGVALLSREGEEEPAVGPDAQVATPEPSSAPTLRSGPAPSPGALHERMTVIALAIVTAAGWGLGPVLIEQAQRALGGNSATMMLMSQAIGLVLVLPIVVARRRVLLRPLQAGERRLLVSLILASAALEAVFAIAYYFLIDNIGAVLTVLIIATSPVFSILGGVLLLKEKYNRWLAIGALLTLAGVVIAILGTSG